MCSPVLTSAPPMPTDFAYECLQSESARLLAEKDEEILKLRRQLQNVANKAYKFRKGQILDENREVETIDVGITSPVLLPKQMVENIKDRYRLRPQQFMRALMELPGMFTLEQIASCSVYGNKTATSPNNFVRPALGPDLLALKAYTVSQCGLAEGSSARIKFEESVRRICSDARKRVKNRKGTN